MQKGGDQGIEIDDFRITHVTHNADDQLRSRPLKRHVKISGAQEFRHPA